MKEKRSTITRAKAAILALTIIAGLIGGFTNMVGAMSITSVEPEQGLVEGGTEVRIYGDFTELAGAVQITAGSNHTCAFDIAGRVYCWGDNGKGQLGDDSNSQKYTPVTVNTSAGIGAMDDKTVVQITAGGQATCALDLAGQVYCWGHNGYGQLGDNSVIDRTTPVAVNATAGTGDMADKTITKISTSGFHTCAIDSFGQVYCWGYNYMGLLGNNSYTNQNTPVAVNTTAGTGDMAGKTIVQVSTGSSHTCALDSVGYVYCWGANGNGQLGDNSSSQKYTPVAVNTTAGTGDMNSKTITQITIGDGWFTCALDTAGQVYCWGQNNYGQLGDNSFTDSLTPVAVNTSVGTGVMNGKAITQIAAGIYHVCALDNTSQIYCWGRNNLGQLGDNSFTDSLTPVAVDTTAGTGVIDGKDIAQIVAGAYHTCALDVAGQIYCWGTGGTGQLGRVPLIDSSTPVCVHTIFDGTGSELPGLGCGRELVVTMDIDGEPAECIDVVVADDGLSLTCTTSAHVAGWVDVTIEDGVNTVVLANGYEYVENFGDGGEEEEGGGGGIIGLIEKILSPDSGFGGVAGWIVLGEVAFIVVGVGVFFRLRES
ncbi:MAG: hypothetical protein FWH55_10725 [Oscillospiraceae bacterium]|nr:hypothetical protein [Oscillospiraceae bacterium]